MIAGGGVTINGAAGDRPGRTSRSRSPGSGSTSGSASVAARSGAQALPSDASGRGGATRSDVDDLGRADGRARRAARARGRAGRRPRRRGPRAWPRGPRRPPRPTASSLAAIRTSVASSVTLRPAASTPPSSRRAVYEPAGRVGGALGDRRPERLEPGEALASSGRPGAPSGSKQLRVPAVAGRADRVDRDEERVAVAVDGEVDAAAGRCRSSRPCATAGRATGSGSGPRRSRASRPAPRRPCRRPSAPGRRRRPGRRPGRGRRGPKRDGRGRLRGRASCDGLRRRAGRAGRPRPSPP